MEYITLDQFLESEEIVKNSILAWYKTNVKVGDIVYNPNNGNEHYLLKDESYVSDLLCGYMGNVIPILTTLQLTEYSQCVLGIDTNKVVNEYIYSETELIQTLWNFVKTTISNYYY